MGSLKQRNLQPELMDDLTLEDQELARALSAIRRVNVISGVASRFWPSIFKLAKNSPRPLHILDVATGSGDIPISLLGRAKREGISLQIEAIDINEKSISLAKQRGMQAGINFIAADALKFEGEYDVILCSLFLHHLENQQIIQLLNRMRDRARYLCLISDLRRSRVSWLAAGIGTRILTTSSIAQIDALKSVEGALTKDELRKLAVTAGMAEAKITNVWPFRMLLQYDAQRTLT